MPTVLTRASSLLRITALAAALAVVSAAVVTIGGAPSASATASPQTVFVNEGFTGSAVGAYLKPSAPSGSNVACLTASGSTSATPVPGCSSTAIDTVGNGALRLTSAGNTLEGGVGSTQSVPISKGLDASFDSYQYGGTKADGIVFYLAATDPYDPQVPQAIGQPGGSLGYSPTGASAGLAHGYLGLGLDDYGNYLSSSFGGSGCSNQPSSSTQPTNVSVRGPGNGSVGYCVLPGYNSSLGGPTALHGSARATSDVPVEVVVNPSSSSTTSAGTSKLAPVSVAAMSYAIVFKTIGASSQTIVTGTLPDLRQPAYSGLVSPSWYDPSSGLPYKLSYGWVASTGGSTDIHEVNYLNAQTVNGPVPALSSTSSSRSATVATGSSASLSVDTAVDPAGGSESSPVRVTTTFPAGLTPTAYSGTDYTCSISGQVETCTYSGTTAAGSNLPTLTLPFTAAGSPNATPATVSSVVSSVDATAVTTTTAFTITTAPTTTTVTATPSIASYGAPATLTATVSPSAATGTVAFVDSTTGTTLCAAAPLSSGVATCATTASTIGTDTITASYGGSSTYAASSGTTTLATTVAATSVGVTASPAEVAFGQSSTLTATGLPTGATGTVSFTSAGGAVLCSVAAPARSCTTSTSLGAGAYAVTAHYTGDSHYAASSSATTAPLTVDKAATTLLDTVNGSGASSSSYGTPAALAATGTASGATGTITFTDASSGDVLCTATLSSATCPTSSTLRAGTYAVHAFYSGDADHASAGTASDSTLTVSRQAAATLTASVDHPAVAFGSPATFSTSGVPTGATGTVTFTAADGTVVCTATLPASSCRASAILPVGAYLVTATYSGDANHVGAASTTQVDYAVAAAATAITATVDGRASESVRYGTQTALAVAGLPAVATGTVTFTDEAGATLCTVTLPAASCETRTDLSAGSYRITAAYAGDANHLASAAAPVTLTVAKADSSLATTVNRAATARIVHGSTATLDTSGLPDGATGTVKYEAADGTILCTATLPDSACATAASLEGGSYRITALYSGDADHAPSAGPTISLVVAKQKVTMGAGSATPAPRAHTVGGTTTLTVTGMPAGATGTVAFSQNGHTLCVVKLPATSCTTTLLGPGTQSVTAAYSGDTSYAASTAKLSVVVPGATPAGLAFTGSTLPIAATGAVAALVVGLGALLMLLGRRGRGVVLRGRRRRGAHVAD